MKKKIILTLVLAIVSSVWMTNEASNWCMPASQTSTEQPIRIGGTFQTDIFPCVDETEPCPPCLTIVLASGGHYYLVSDDPQIVATLDTVTIGSFAIIEGIHYLLEHHDYINVTHIFFPEIDMTQLTGEWEVYKETVSTPTGDAGTRWFSTHDVNNTNYIIENNSIYKVVLDQASGYAHYSDIVPYSIERKEDGTWLLTAEGLFSSANPVDEGIPTPVTIYKLTENEIEWVFAANGGDEGPNYYYQYLRRYTNTQNDKLPSLCDEWNVLDFYYNGQGFPYFTSEYKLKNDTIIGAYTYKQLRKDGGDVKVTNEYVGALREDNNARIYYIPADTEHEFLLYAFNAQVGDTLTNLWVGGNYKWYPNGHKAVVREIKDGTPKTFVIEAYENGDEDSGKYTYIWIEGIGSQFEVTGDPCPFYCAGCGAHNLLCAYKNGQKIYESEYVEQFGCVFNGDISSAYEWYGIEAQGREITGLTYELTGDTTISGFHFNKLYLTREGGTRTYQGAVRYSVVFEIGRPMYYIPKDYIPEGDVFGGFPLQKFDVDVGDTVQAYSGMSEMPCEGDATIPYIVTDIRYIDARKHVYVKATGHNGQELKSEWIEGIGTPYIIWSGERSCQSTDGSTVIQYTLCAYNNGEQVYVSEAGEKYGCEYNNDHHENSTDTIPLYTRDDSGSSTVDPVDPNQIYATLTGDKLTVHNNTGAQVTFTLNNTSVNNIAARVRTNTGPVSFTESISVELSEDGIYEILLTSEEWNYTIFGTVNYIRSGTDITKEESSTTKKVLRGTQIFIEREGKTYTLTGQEIK